MSGNAEGDITRQFTDQLLEQILAGHGVLQISCWLAGRLPIAPWVANVLAWGVCLRDLWEARWIANLAAEFQADCRRRRAQGEAVKSFGGLFYRIADRECLQKTGQPLRYWHAVRKQESRPPQPGRGEQQRKIG